jgi:DNA mismatch repair protein MutL
MNQRKVQVLPDFLANQIAAGEVIQRPESVVKELLENSLDAGAKNISVIIKDAGKKLIQIVDDGSGMDEEDAIASFLRHATSKIATIDDLEGIATYGFRGEALASVASVAQVTMKTRRAEDDAAVVVQIDGGNAPRISKEGREVGTSITVQNLFFNVPARRKFLKSNPTEFRHIADTVQRVALSHPEVSIKFISENETILDLKTGDLQNRLLDVFGQRQVEAMVPMGEQSDYVSLSGYVGKPVFGQKSRANQYLFLNKRYITNKNIAHAVYTAYENLLIKGTFPFFLLFIEIDPHRVDVNVHPSKMEAKFEDEQNIYRFVSNVVRRTLASNDLVPAISAGASNIEADAIGLRFTNRQHSWQSNLRTVDLKTGEIFPSLPFTPRYVEPRIDFDGDSMRQGPEPANGDVIAEKLLAPIEERFKSLDPPRLPSTENSEEISASLIWQLHKKYILTPIKNGMMIVDQHVAHERILYERAMQRFESNSPVSQQVLFPQTIQLTPGDYALVNELQSYFEKLGFSIKAFGGNTIIVEGTPSDVRFEDESKIIQDILTLYKEYQQHGHMDARDNLAKSFSCKAAIKAGDPLNTDEMRSLLEQLFQTNMPYVCPHGRPVVLKVSIEELDRRFGRT